MTIFQASLYPAFDPATYAVVAIPANNEAERIEACVSALSMQRDRFGSPLPAGTFEILLFANNCTDETASLARAMTALSPHPIRVETELLPADKANAGWARKRAMDLAALRLTETGHHSGYILTTDADSCVSPTWVSANLEAFAGGADCVAGYIDAQPAEMVRLGSTFLARGRLEDRYLRAVAEIYARCDPRPHDPWPNHRVSSGASLGITLAAYRAIGGLPPRPLGEDTALTQTLECAGFKVRHSMDICVSTSCRFDGRAKGGAADTMQHRHAVPDAVCDGDLEPALFLVRRAILKGRLRRLSVNGLLGRRGWSASFGLDVADEADLLPSQDPVAFEAFWLRVAAASPILNQPRRLRPADLPGEIRRAEMVLRLLRPGGPARTTSDQADRSRHAGSRESAAA